MEPWGTPQPSRALEDEASPVLTAKDLIKVHFAPQTTTATHQQVYLELSALSSVTHFFVSRRGAEDGTRLASSNVEMSVKQFLEVKKTNKLL